MMICFFDAAALSADEETDSDEESDEEISDSSTITNNFITYSLDETIVVSDFIGTLEKSESDNMVFKTSGQYEQIIRSDYYALSGDIWKHWSNGVWTEVSVDTTAFFNVHFIKTKCTRFWFVFLDELV